ncbi:MAG TPA: hypothetical protein VLC48_00815, partial [Gemmatimonadota bacterium]|nr:hypothetical protein [Gemmatimonadota bacterium]
WLERRLADTPSPLRGGLEKAIADLDPDQELSVALLTAARDTLESIRDRLEEREAAFALLVADGLLTLACDAAAFNDPATVAERCREMGPGGELGRLAKHWAGRT